MDPISKIEKAVADELVGLKLQYFLAGVMVPPADVANKSGFLPFLFEQQQVLADMIGIPKDFQPTAFGQVIVDESALLGKTLQVKSPSAVVPLISYLTDAARMTARLAVNQMVDLGKFVDPDPDTPHLLSAVLDHLVNHSDSATQAQDPVPQTESVKP